jgi:hypothetical protein
MPFHGETHVISRASHYRVRADRRIRQETQRSVPCEMAGTGATVRTSKKILQQISMTKSQDKIAIITGGSRGLGRSTVLSLAKRGVDSIFTYRSNQSEAENVTELVVDSGRRAIAFELDTGRHEGNQNEGGAIRSLRMSFLLRSLRLFAAIEPLCLHVFV